MRAVPVSMTYLMPGTVSEVSATFVARTTRRRMPGVCSALEDPVLVGRGQPAVQRQDLGARVALALDGVLRRRGSRSRRTGTRARRPGPRGASSSRASVMPCRSRGRRRCVAAVAGARSRTRRRRRSSSSGLVGDERAVPDLDRVGAAGDLDDGGVVEVLRERLRVDRRARDDELEVGATGEQPLQVPEQEVDRQGRARAPRR